MKPYYEEAGVTIYCADCREILPVLVGDVVIMDPPYNVGKKYGVHDDQMPPECYRDWMIAVLSLCADATEDSVVFFPGTANLLSVSRWLGSTSLRHIRTLAWHKKEFAGDLWSGGPAMCWEPIIWASHRQDVKPFFNRIFGTGGRDCLVVNATHGNPFAASHPCPKPIPVMRWLVSLFAPVNGLVIDPFAGTGTTLRAAKDLGRRAIGIEIEERYCEIAAQRLAQGTLSLEESA